MGNSPLVNYTKISPNKTSPRNHRIDTVTIHCVVGQVSVETLGEIFKPKSKQASSNYGIGLDGRIGLYVDEGDRSWCSSNAENDNRAVTIEVASDTKEPYAVTDKAFKSLLDLVTDICRRNGIEKLVWSEKKSERVNHLNGCNMTVHRDYANKSCPGTYLYERHGEIAKEVNKRLGADNPKELYRVRKSWEDAASQIGAFTDLQNALEFARNNRGYSVYDGAGKCVYPVKVPYLVRVKKTGTPIYKEPNGSVTGGAAVAGVYTVIEGRDGFGRLKSGAGWIRLNEVDKL